MKDSELDVIKLLGNYFAVYINHNDHKTYHVSAKDWIDENDENELFDWANNDSKNRAVEQDSIWTILLYPRTSHAFYAVAAPTLSEALERIIYETN